MERVCADGGLRPEDVVTRAVMLALRTPEPWRLNAAELGHSLREEPPRGGTAGEVGP